MLRLLSKHLLANINAITYLRKLYLKNLTGEFWTLLLLVMDACFNPTNLQNLINLDPICLCLFTELIMNHQFTS